MRHTVIRHEIVVGWFITAALILGAAALLLRSRAPGTLIAPHRVKFSVAHGKGLQLAAPVLLQGIQVGEVDGVELTPTNEVVVTCRIYDRYAGNLREDTVAKVVAPPVLGNTKVELVPGTAPKLARSGQVLSSTDDLSLLDRVGGLQGEVQAVVAHVDSLAVTATEALNEVRSIAARIDAGEGMAGRLIRDEGLADDAEATLSHVRGAAQRLEGEVLDQAVAAVDSGRELLTELRSDEGRLMTLLADVDQTVLEAKRALEAAKLAETVAGLREAVAKFQEASASIGPMSDDTRQAMRALGEASRALQVLSEELARQPNSVIFGRTPSPGPGVGR